jgi:hypothetical protein
MMPHRLSLTQQRAYADGSDRTSISVPSNHLSTAQKLIHKQVVQKDVAREQPPNFELVWAELQEKLGDKEKLKSAEESLEILKIPLTTEYDNEINFSKALFEAIRQCLSHRNLELDRKDDNIVEVAPKDDNIIKLASKDDNIIVLKVGKTEEYAVGLARQSSVAKGLQIEIMGECDDSVDGTDNESKGRSTPDHSVRLFRKDSDDRWRVSDCFAVAKLKLNDTSCQEFPMWNNAVDGVSLADKHGALGQVMLQTIECVLPYHARRGVLGKYLPLAIIAGRRNKPNGNSLNRLRWVSGRLEIPEACGGRFHFCVEDFGHFHHDTDEEEDASVKNALAVYLDTVLFGLTEAIKVHNDLVENRMRPAVPASGQCLMIGEALLDLRFCASPIPGANPLETSNEDDSWIISQGDLFTGKLNVSETLMRSRSERIDFFAETFSKEVDVIAKVSSLTVHNILIDPRTALSALKTLKTKRKIRKEIGAVLYSVIEMKAGLVTIMADLSKQGYQTLKPREQRDKLDVLWAGFADLVENVLLPMAKIGIIHPDIRPGFDVTSNMLCKLEDNDTRAVIKLIDYESLISFQYWIAPVNDGRYVKPGPTWNATTFVWWQCICLAYAWHHQLDANTLRQGHFFWNLVLDFNGSRSIGWLQDFTGGENRKDAIDGKFVKVTLSKLGKLFKSTS